MGKPEKITLLSSIIIVGFTFAVIYHYILGFYLGLDYPANTFLSPQFMFISDFKGILGPISNFNPFEKTNFWICYFPLAYIILFPFTLIKNTMVSYLIFCLGFLTCFTYLNARFLKCESLTKVQNFQNIFILSFLSYPLLYILDRGNFDMFLLILFTAFIYLFKFEKYFWAAILIGIANACKPFSILFLLLFLFEKKYKEFFISIFLSTLLIIGGFIAIKGDFIHNVATFIINLKILQEFFVYQLRGGMTNCSSLFMSLKALLCLKYNLISTYTLAKACKYISLILGVIAIYSSWKEKIFWKQISILTFAMLVLPNIVFDYKLMFLFVPIWLFVTSKEKSNFDLIYTLLFGLLLIPKDLPIGIFLELSLSVLLNPFIMILFAGLIIFEQIKYKKQEVQN